MYFNDYYYLGTITKKHGLKGYLIMKLDTDEPELYENMESIFLDFSNELIPFFILDSKLKNFNTLFIKFDYKNLENLIGKKAYLPLNTLPILEGKKFYYHDIINYQIINDENTIGHIIDINDSSPQHLFLVENNNHQFYIPIINEWIINIDREKKIIQMDLPEGLNDL